MQSIRTYIIILFLLSSLFNSKIHGQEHVEWDYSRPYENLRLDEMQVRYKRPSNFKSWMINVSSDPIISSGGYDTMHSPDENFMILLELYPLTPFLVSTMKTFHPELGDRDLDSLYLENIEQDLKKSLRDKYKSFDKSPIKYYSAKVAKKKFNADNAFTYPIIRRKRLEGKEFCQAIVIQKNKRGAIKMLCFYNKMSKSQLKKYIKMAEELFYFRDPEDFVPFQINDSIITLPKTRKNY